MSLSMLLALGYPLGGFIGMCGYLPFQADLDEAIIDEETEKDEYDPFANSDTDDESKSKAKDPAFKTLIFERDLLSLPPVSSPTRSNTAQATPIFLGHGDVDEKVPYKLGEAAARTLRAAGYEVAWNLYQNQGHWYKIPEEIDDIVDFIQTRAGWAVSQE
ncbi:hypothetical protein M426DRAFT_188836 [Hypoxylon sp. CI-4A]|nr:hypothetical protein M426DRAFT_188836 [Hypoxylon sp. CI-4A]